MYVHKSCTFYLLCSLRGARARQLTTTTATATIVLEIQIQKLQPLWDHQLAMGPWGDGNGCCVPNLLLHCSAIYWQSKCNAKQM